MHVHQQRLKFSIVRIAHMHPSILIVGQVFVTAQCHPICFEPLVSAMVEQMPSKADDHMCYARKKKLWGCEDFTSSTYPM